MRVELVSCDFRPRVIRIRISEEDSWDPLAADARKGVVAARACLAFALHHNVTGVQHHRIRGQRVPVTRRSLLVELREKRGLALLFISHDLGVVRYLCDHTLVMDRGRVVESGPSDRIWASPTHEITRRLQAAGGGAID